MDGIVFRTSDVRWNPPGGLGTGGNLTALQGDENMWELLTRIQALENDPPVAISVSGFTVIGSQFMVNMSDASTRGPFDLPIATFRLQGEWTHDMPLLKLDVISVIHQGLYLVNIAHTTPHTGDFDPLATDTDPLSPTFGQLLYTLVFGEDITVYDVGFFFPGKPGIGIEAFAPMFSHVFVKKVLLSATLPDSIARMRIGSLDPMSFIINVSGTDRGFINFAVGATSGTFDFITDVTVDVGDVLYVLRPADVDDDARDLSVTFKAIRVF